ncbi:mariner mos1 transposase [Trichonephila clavipes]|nr:mariner mos1 transposase [Trichonephila clavipes]
MTMQQPHSLHHYQLPSPEQHPGDSSPPYSPDLAPCDFLFQRLKREMKGKHWETVENIQHHVTTFLRNIPVEEFQGAFQAWQTRLRKCIDAGGMYFEKY